MSKYCIITGPSAVGKSTLINHMLLDPVFFLSVSYTTRSPRPGEKDGADYYFVSKEEFEYKINEGFFLEHTYFSGNYYGTPAHLNTQNKIILFDIDIVGYEFFKKNSTSAYFCLINSTYDIIKQRLQNRMIVQHGEIQHEALGTRMKSFDAFQKICTTEYFNMVIDNSMPLKESLRNTDKLIMNVKQYFSMENEQ
ncbi:guanylate kinase [Enteropsectra breve]|nr:guanylate kinase [Enteropsectra breve]